MELPPIHTANPRANYLRFEAEITKALGAALIQDQYVLGSIVRNFEQNFANYVGVEYGIGVNSGTDALHLALRAAGIGPGDEVITVANTAVATVAAVELAGASPVLVDVEFPWYTIDPEKILEVASPRTKAIIAVHLFGQPVDITGIRQICDEQGWMLIEDCAQAHGATWQQRKVGSFGDFSCFSFYPTKNLAAIGDGGMVLCSDPSLANRLRMQRQYGWSNAGVSEITGLNSRLGILQAAILDVKLLQLDVMLQRRVELARAYTTALAEVPLVLPGARPGASHAWHLFVVQCEDQRTRDGLRSSLASEGVFAGIHYPLPIHRQPAYAGRLRCGALQRTEAAAGTILSLPLHSELTDEEQLRVLKGVLHFFGRDGRRHHA